MVYWLDFHSTAWCSVRLTSDIMLRLGVNKHQASREFQLTNFCYFFNLYGCIELMKLSGSYNFADTVNPLSLPCCFVSALGRLLSFWLAALRIWAILMCRVPTSINFRTPLRIGSIVRNYFFFSITNTMETPNTYLKLLLQKTFKNNLIFE